MTANEMSPMQVKDLLNQSQPSGSPKASDSMGLSDLEHALAGLMSPQGAEESKRNSKKRSREEFEASHSERESNVQRRAPAQRRRRIIDSDDNRVRESSITEPMPIPD